MTEQKLEIVSFNCRSLNSRLSEFKIFVYTTKPHIICLTETWLKEDYIPNIINYRSFWKNRQNRQGGGIGILVRSDIPVIPSDIQDYEDKLEVQSLAVKVMNGTLRIVNVYNPIGTTPFVW